MGGNLKKIVTFGTKCFFRYSWHVCYLGCPLLRGFTVVSDDGNKTTQEESTESDNQPETIGRLGKTMSHD